ncbi:MAG: TetR/AcrR family transcriptional regulator [Deltaproteobacteria bacterium]|nr:TetR/AcrR family transcriptional regulator [Deltaproteobacteria bacterium]
MKPEETREKILVAADDLFGELGFDATTTRDIAARSGVNKALIHYHFGTKDDLLEALLDGYYARLTETLLTALGARAGRSLEEQAEDVLDAYGDFLAENRTFCCIVQREVGSGQHVERIVARTLPAFQVGVQWLGRIAPHAPEGLELIQVLTSVYGMVVTYFTHGHVLQRLTGADPFSPKALEARKRHVRRVASLLLREIQRKPASRAGRKGGS